MPDQTLDQLNEVTDAQDADLLYTVRDGLDHKTKRGTIVAGKVSATRQVATGTGLTGGGDLTADRTISLNVLGLTENLAPVLNADYVLIHETASNAPRRVRLDRLPTNPSQQNTFLNVAVSGQPTIVADGNTDTLNVAAGSNIALTTSSVTDTLTISATGLVPTSRNIGAGAGLTGGGDLTANRSLAVDISGQIDSTSPTLADHFLLSYDSVSGGMRKLRASLLGGSSYTLPVATGSVLGGVRIGSGLSVDSNGTVTLSYTMPAATSVSLGGVKVGSNLSVAGDGTISANPAYTLPIASAGSLGGIRIGTGLTIDGSGVVNATASGGSSYTLPVATVSTLGGVKQGGNVTIAGDGAISVAAPYSLPIASASVLGGIKIGSGLAIDAGGVVTASGGSSYTLPAATSSVLGGVKIGTGITVSGDGTITVPPTGGTPNDGVFRPTGIVRGTGNANSVRNNNRLAIQAAIDAMNAQGSGTVALGGGTIEIGGSGTSPDPLTAPLKFNGAHNDIRVFDGQGAKIIQTTDGANIIQFDGCRHHTIRNCELRYANAQTTGSGFSYDVTLNPHAAIRLKDSMMNKFENIAIRNQWCGIVNDSDDATGAGGGGSYSNHWSHIEINMGANSGYGIAQRRGTGSVWNNIYITGNGQNVACRGGVLLLSTGQNTFNQLNCEWMKCRYALQADACNGLVINSPNFEGNTPTNSNASGFGVLMHFSSLTTVTINGGTIANTQFDQTANGVANGVLFSAFAQSHVEVRGVHIAATKKTGTVRASLFGTDGNVPMDQAYGQFYNITLRRTSGVDYHNLDDLCWHTLSSAPVAAGSGGTTHGPLRIFNNFVGVAFGVPVTWGLTGATGSAATTIYPMPHGNWQRFNSVLTGNVTITLSNKIEPALTDATLPIPRLPSGTTMRVTRTAAASGAFTFTVNNHNGTAVTTINAGQSADFLFNGTDWSLLHKLS